jgi:hypothetical protein
MEAWCARLLETGARARRFAFALMEEEKRKLVRLATLSNSIGLPLHKTYSFDLPRDKRRIIGLCSSLEKMGCKLSFRLTGEDGRLLFRDVDAHMPIIAAIIAHLPHPHRSTAHVSPYKEPTISGNVLVASGNAWLELVYGPHYWLTKGAPSGVGVLRCCYRFPHLSVQYSTQDRQQRAILLGQLKDVLRMALGVSIRMLPEVSPSLYAEYHWRRDLGYRFLECSYSAAWTGIVSEGTPVP